jgi:hypothetical protein
MGAKKLISIIFCALILSLAITMTTSISVQAQLSPGVDAFQSTMDLEIVLPNETVELVKLIGQTIIRRSPAGDADSDGFADQPTEIVRLEVKGKSVGLGEVTILAGAQNKLPDKTSLPASIGQTEELLIGATFPAYNFFDLFAILEASGGPVTNGIPIKAVNEKPANLAAVIDEVPPLRVPHKEKKDVIFVVVDPPGAAIKIIAKKIIHTLQEGRAPVLPPGKPEEPGPPNRQGQGGRAPVQAPRSIKDLRLYQNYPNPFNAETWIPYELSKEGRVSIRIYNALYQLVRRIDIGYQLPGSYISPEAAAHWDGKNEQGENLASGVYFYTIQFNYSGTIDVKRMILLK